MRPTTEADKLKMDYKTIKRSQRALASAVWHGSRVLWSVFVAFLLSEIEAGNVKCHAVIKFRMVDETPLPMCIRDLRSTLNVDAAMRCMRSQHPRSQTRPDNNVTSKSRFGDLVVDCPQVRNEACLARKIPIGFGRTKLGQQAAKQRAKVLQ